MPAPTRILLEFDPSQSEADTPVRSDLSVAVRTGNDLWVASDETATLERLSLVEPHRFAAHRHFELREFLDLPEDDGEVDIEGIGFDGAYLWIAGSHSLKRKKPKKRLSEADQIARLARVTREPNRFLLARIPCIPAKDGSYTLHREVDAPRRIPGGDPARLTAAQLAWKGDGNLLTRAIEDDAHLAPYLEIPGKDNGFDIEGLALHHGRVHVGLRGPVLRGYAVVLSFEVEQAEDDPHELRLVRRVVAESDGEPVERGYAKHFLDLEGMGIRELRPLGRDLLVLAGPTMALDGTIAVFRWAGGAETARDSIVRGEQLTRLFDIPHGPGVDRAEGMTLWEEGGETPGLLVVYDSPAEERLAGRAGVYADLFPLP